MSKQSDSEEQAPQDEETMAKLLKIAGPRAAIPSSVESRVYESVLAEWQSSTREPESGRVYDRVLRTWQTSNAWSPWRRWILPMGVAASALIAVMLLTQPEPVPQIPLGTISKIVGTAAGSSKFVLNQGIHAGETLSTGAGEGLSLLLARSESLRIGENTQIRMDAKDRFTLISGRVYADTGEFVYRDRGLIITTTLGSVRDVGTQFAVSIEDELLDVAVREGRVDVKQDADTFVAVAGERLLVTKDGHTDTVAVAKYSEYWSWVSDLAPSYDIENKSLLDFLKWAARETGMELVFESNLDRMSAMRTDLHGSIAAITPIEALEAVLATTSYQYRIEADRIVIQR